MQDCCLEGFHSLTAGEHARKLMGEVLRKIKPNAFKTIYLKTLK